MEKRGSLLFFYLSFLVKNLYLLLFYLLPLTTSISVAILLLYYNWIFYILGDYYYIIGIALLLIIIFYSLGILKYISKIFYRIGGMIIDKFDKRSSSHINSYDMKKGIQEEVVSSFKYTILFFFTLFAPLILIVTLLSMSDITFFYYSIFYFTLTFVIFSIAKKYPDKYFLYFGKIRPKFLATFLQFVSNSRFYNFSFVEKEDSSFNKRFYGKDNWFHILDFCSIIAFIILRSSSSGTFFILISLLNNLIEGVATRIYIVANNIKAVKRSI